MTDRPAPPPGWYLDGQDPRRRYWDGKQWTEHFEGAEQSEPARTPIATAASPIAAAGSKMRDFIAAQREKHRGLPPAQLDAIMAAEIARWTAKGWRLEASTKLFGRAAMLREPLWRALLRDLVLTVVTLGIWLIYMLYRGVIGRTYSKIITVNRHGVVRSFRRVDDAYAWSGE